jgi:hypothetical protein
MAMTVRDAVQLRARWRDGIARPEEIADALDELVRALEQRERAAAKVQALIPPVRQIREAAAQADEWMARNVQPDKFPGQSQRH